MAIAFAAWRSKRTCRVRMPRNSSQDSNGPSTPPIRVRASFTSSQRSSAARVASTPAVTSLCPARYFVAEWKTTSAPRSSARSVTAGVAVASTPRTAPAAWAISAVARTSITSQVGLTEGSIHTTAVAPAPTAASSPSGAAASKNATSMPRRSASRRSQSAAPWYMTRGATTRSPARTVSKNVVTPASPEANTSASSAPSSSASTASTCSQVGLPERLYP